MLWRVGENWSSGMDLGDVLRTVENAAPVDAVAAVTRGIGADLGAVSVSFLVADLSGRALVRLAHVPIGDLPGRRRQDEDVATVLPFDGGPQEQALRSQSLLVRTSGDEFVVLAPVTHRGDVIGLLEINLPVEPDHAALTRVSEAAHVLAFVVISGRTGAATCGVAARWRVAGSRHSASSHSGDPRARRGRRPGTRIRHRQRLGRTRLIRRAPTPWAIAAGFCCSPATALITSSAPVSTGIAHCATRCCR
jgi:hypothetical protein